MKGSWHIDLDGRTVADLKVPYAQSLISNVSIFRDGQLTAQYVVFLDQRCSAVRDPLGRLQWFESDDVIAFRDTADDIDIRPVAQPASFPIVYATEALVVRDLQHLFEWANSDDYCFVGAGIVELNSADRGLLTALVDRQSQSVVSVFRGSEPLVVVTAHQRFESREVWHQPVDLATEDLPGI